MTDPGTWQTIEELKEWLNDTLPQNNNYLMLRRDKITEENGELSEALQGVYGANPRKGYSHTWYDVESETCDVILTAMVFLASVTNNPQKVFEHHLQRVSGRSLQTEKEDTA